MKIILTLNFAEEGQKLNNNKDNLADTSLSSEASNSPQDLSLKEKHPHYTEQEVSVNETKRLSNYMDKDAFEQGFIIYKNKDDKTKGATKYLINPNDHRDVKIGRERRIERDNLAVSNRQKAGMQTGNDSNSTSRMLTTGIPYIYDESPEEFETAPTYGATGDKVGFFISPYWSSPGAFYTKKNQMIINPTLKKALQGKEDLLITKLNKIKSEKGEFPLILESENSKLNGYTGNIIQDAINMNDPRSTIEHESWHGLGQVSKNGGAESGIKDPVFLSDPPKNKQILKRKS